MFRVHRAQENRLQPGMAFRQALIASLRCHFEWDRILSSEKYKPKPLPELPVAKPPPKRPPGMPPEPPAASPPPPWARLIALRPVPEPQPADTVTVERGAAEEPIAARTTKEVRK
jgi:hypothetical protein